MKCICIDHQCWCRRSLCASEDAGAVGGTGSVAAATAAVAVVELYGTGSGGQQAASAHEASTSHANKHPIPFFDCREARSLVSVPFSNKVGNQLKLTTSFSTSSPSSVTSLPCASIAFSATVTPLILAASLMPPLTNSGWIVLEWTPQLCRTRLTLPAIST